MKKSLLTRKDLSFFSKGILAGVIIATTQSIGVQPVYSQIAKAGKRAPAGTQMWAVNPFEQRVFVESKGQFDNKNDIDGTVIRFGVRDAGTDIYFTSSGLTYRHDEYKEPNEEEIVSASKSASTNEEDNDRVMTKTISHFVNMTWIGANPDAQIVPSDIVADYYTYPDMKDKSGKSGIQASAFKKITYKNLYPFIDVEYTFPANKPGIKYALILHPGADASLIKMHYSRISNPAGEETTNIADMMIDENGNAQIETPFGNITDHAPVSYYANGEQISSAFNLSGETVSFKLPVSVDGSREVIIDPWTTNPVFSTFNSAYDVDFDLAGNVYVYGGGYPWQEIKFDNTGTKKWTYTASLLYSSGCTAGPCYGDFAVCASSQSSYIVEAFNGGSGTKVIKLNNSGIQIGLYPGNTNFGEMWRIAYNNCTGQSIIAGGGTQYPYQACLLDTNVATMVPVNILTASEALHDVALLAIDNYNNCFMATAKSQVYPSNYDNTLLKCPANTLLPVAYKVPDNHGFIEVNSVSYVNNIVSEANGFNGMAVDNKYVYTYNGAILKKWNKNTGTLVKSITLSATPFQAGGLDINDCGNIFAGTKNSVIQLDTNLVAIDTIPVSGTIYDLKLGPGNMLYAAGAGFVQAITLNSVTCGNLNLTTAVTPDSCGGQGSATVTAIGGVGPFTYTWSNGQTTQTVTGLSAGTYSVTVKDKGFVPCSSVGGATQSIDVIVPGGSSFNAKAGPDTEVCAGFTVQLNCSTPGTSYAWSPSFGLSDTTIANPVVTAFTTTTYSVTVTSGGCKGDASVTVKVFPFTPTPNLTETKTAPYDTIYCDDDPSIIAHQWYANDTLLNGETGIYYIAGRSGNYNVVVTDTNGCQVSVGINIIIKKNVGLHDLSGDHSVVIYPNPANDELNVVALSLLTSEPVTITITDVLGKVVQHEKIYWSNKTAVNIRNLTSGIYFLQLSRASMETEGRKWIRRFVKE